MSLALAFVGEEIEAAGFRLGGGLAYAPARGEEGDAFRRACEQAAVVVLSAACAARLDPEALEAALARVAPMVFILPGSDGGTAPHDPVARVRRRMGGTP